jgi:hypothetical protein
LFLLGAGHFTDRYLAERISAYRSLEERKLAVWDKPERGLISGVVTDVTLSAQEFTLRSPSNMLHTVRMDSLPASEQESIVVGATLRVLAPLVLGTRMATAPEQETFALTEETAADENAATGMMMTSMAESDATMAADNVDFDPMFAADMHEQEAVHMKAAPALEMAEEQVTAQEREGAKMFRAACALLPTRDVENDAQRAAVEECLRELREERARRAHEAD